LQANSGRQAGKSKHAGREAGMGGRQAYRHAKAGWQRKRQECMQLKRSKAWPADTQARTDQKRYLGKQESRLAPKKGQVKAARDRSRQAEVFV
jgi:hypothetical protein